MILWLIIFCSFGFAQDSALVEYDIINSPSMSLRCKEMFSIREEKVTHKQKLSSLLNKNTSLLKKTPEQKQSLKKRLQANQIKVRNELDLSDYQIKALEENIVRSGCPGLSI